MRNMLYLLHFVFYLMDLSCLSYGNYDVIQCESTYLNISCDNDTTILINEVHVGPLSDTQIYNTEVSSLNKNTSNISTVCNNRNNCFIGSRDQDYLNLFTAPPRLVNITFNCYHEGYEFIGCYVDNKKRLFTGPSALHTVAMSALICKDFCSQQGNIYEYFGTENTNECFCGSNVEIYKLNQTLYKKRATEECDAPCAGNQNEMCGRNGLISVYKTEQAYEYVGCFDDFYGNLFTAKSHYGEFQMSASICRSFCSQGTVFHYFGIRNGYVCFCGTETESIKLNRNLHTKRDDYWYCNVRCLGTYNGRCGSTYQISVYKSIFDPLKTATVKARDFPNLSLCSSKMINVQLESYQISTYCEKETSKVDPQQAVSWIENDGSELDNDLTKYVRINYSCEEIISNPEVRFNLEKENAAKAGIAIAVLSGIVLVGAVLTGLFILKRRRHKNKRQHEQHVASNINVQELSEYVNVQNSYKSETSPQSEITYSVVDKGRPITKGSKSGQGNTAFLSSDDLYVDTVEGVYDVSNKPRDKQKHTDRAIYSHTAEDVYDSTITKDYVSNDDVIVENAYDKGFHLYTHGHV